MTDLARYPPTARRVRARREQGITITRGADMTSLLAFESATFPSWTRWFSRPEGDIPIARGRPGNIAGTVLLAGPGAGAVFAPMPGPAAGTIGCAGVAPPRQGHGIGAALVVRASEILRQAGTRNCHIGWTTRESFYRRAGCQPWRRYAMFSSPA